MAGILDFFKKPETQDVLKGVLGAAVTGFNPLIGVLGSVAIGQDRKRFQSEMEEQRESLRGQKLQNDLFEQQLAAPGILGDLMTGGGTFTNPLTGEPVAADENDIIPPQERQRQMLEQASILSPDMAASSVLGGMFGGEDAKPMSVEGKIASDLGVDIKTPEGQERVAEFMARSRGDDLERLTRMAQLEQMLLSLSDNNEAAAQRRDQIEMSKRSAALSIKNDHKRIKESLQIMDALDGTLLEAGVAAPEFFEATARGEATLARALFGKNDEAASRALAMRERLRKNLAVGALRAPEAFSGLGTLTDIKFSLVGDASPSIDNQSATNALLFADNLQSALDNAVIAGIKIDGREDIEETILKIREKYDLFGSTSPVGSLGVTNDLNTDEESELQQRLRTLGVID